MLRVQILEKDQTVEREKEKRSDTERVLGQKNQDLQSQIADLSHRVTEMD